MNNILRASTVILSLVVPFQSSAQAVSAIPLSDQDRAAIIMIAINLRLLREQKVSGEDGRTFPEYKTLSTEGLSSDLVSRLSNLNLTLKKPQEIVKIARRPSGIRYLRVAYFNQEGDKVRLELVAIEREMGQCLTGHSYRYLFEKVRGQWQGKLVYIIC